MLGAVSRAVDSNRRPVERKSSLDQALAFWCARSRTRWRWCRRGGTRHWSTARLASARPPGLPIRRRHPPRRQRRASAAGEAISRLPGSPSRHHAGSGRSGRCAPGWPCGSRYGAGGRHGPRRPARQLQVLMTSLEAGHGRHLQAPPPRATSQLPPRPAATARGRTGGPSRALGSQARFCSCQKLAPPS